MKFQKKKELSNKIIYYSVAFENLHGVIFWGKLFFVGDKFSMSSVSSKRLITKTKPTQECAIQNIHAGLQQLKFGRLPNTELLHYINKHYLLQDKTPHTYSFLLLYWSMGPSDVKITKLFYFSTETCVTCSLGVKIFIPLLLQFQVSVKGIKACMHASLSSIQLIMTSLLGIWGGIPVISIVQTHNDIITEGPLSGGRNWQHDMFSIPQIIFKNNILQPLYHNTCKPFGLWVVSDVWPFSLRHSAV